MMAIPPPQPIFNDEEPDLVDTNQVYHDTPGDLQVSNWGNFIKVEEDFKANVDFEAKGRTYEQKKAQKEHSIVHRSGAINAPQMQQLKEMRAKNLDLLSRSAEKDRRKKKPKAQLAAHRKVSSSNNTKPTPLWKNFPKLAENW